MVTERGRKRLPPYISYRTFHNFVERLQQQLPARIDRSYWGDMLSGSTGTQLMAALRFLDLIDENGRPTDRMKPLVNGRGDQRKLALRDIASNSFNFVLESDLDPQNATYSQFEEIFNDKFQLTGQLSRKCLRFFIELSNDAGITLSPFITKRFRAGYEKTTSKVATKKMSGGTKVITKSTNMKLNRNSQVQQDPEEISSLSPWDKMLLTKFPTFDPTWSDDVKLKWFTAFDELMKRIVSRNDKG